MDPALRLLHVNFGADESNFGERKNKYLTAKYGKQMSGFKKRLNVEMWMFDQLQQLYEIQVSLKIDRECFPFFFD